MPWDKKGTINVYQGREFPNDEFFIEFLDWAMTDGVTKVSCDFVIRVEDDVQVSPEFFGHNDESTEEVNKIVSAIVGRPIEINVRDYTPGLRIT